MRSHPAELIAHKRDGGELTAAQIADLVAGVVDGSLGDAQLGAFLMAVCCRGMTVAETGALTTAMRDSGRVLDLSSVAGVKVDKHSTGGVGDKVSLFLAPMVAAAGVRVPMISGRGLGHTGGTLDKLQAIPGYRTDLDPDEFVDVLGECGFVMAGASAEIAPADRRMYALRDICGTIESVPLITSSILSKKLAEGIDALVLDVKCGRAAFMKTPAEAEALIESLVSTGRAAGVSVTGLVTDMDAPLGRAVGNALEVLEVVECLRGNGPADLCEVSYALGAEMLMLAGVEADPERARVRLRAVVDDGQALRAFEANVVQQGGDPAFLRDPAALGRAAVVAEVRSARGGAVADIDPLAVGVASMVLGAGRRQPSDDIDPVVGIVLGCAVGDAVRSGDALATVHARTDAEAERAVDAVGRAIEIGDEPGARAPLVQRVSR